MEVAMVASRIARRVGIDRNPLRRRTDRVEAWITVALTTVALLLGPFVVWRAGLTAYKSTLSSSERDRHQQRFRVTATLLVDATDYLKADDGVRLRQDTVRALWTAPDGTARTGTIIPPATGAVAGSGVLIWTDAHGNPVSPPVRRDPTESAVMAGFATALALLALVACLRLAVRNRLNKRRLAGWQTEWTLIEPRWSGRR
jgi:hypothetical protein